MWESFYEVIWLQTPFLWQNFYFNILYALIPVGLYLTFSENHKPKKKKKKRKMYLTSHLPRNCDLRFTVVVVFLSSVFVLCSPSWTIKPLTFFFFFMYLFILFYFIVYYFSFISFSCEDKTHKTHDLVFLFSALWVAVSSPAIHRQFFIKTVCNQSSNILR